MTIRSREYPYNMAPWLAEKSESICENASILVEKIQALKIPAEDKNELLDELHPLLYNATKIVEYAYDTEITAWDPGIAQRILERGRLGYKNFISKVKEYSDMG